MTALPHGRAVPFRLNIPAPPRCAYCRRGLEAKASCQGCGAPTDYREPPPLQVFYPLTEGIVDDRAAIRRYQDALDAAASPSPGRRRIIPMPSVIWYTGH